MTALPEHEYRRRLDRLAGTRSVLARRDARLSRARLAVFLIGAVLAVSWWLALVPAWSPVVAALAFVVLVHRHDRVIRAGAAAAGAILYYERGLARIRDEWAGTGERGDRFRDDAHPYATDLDLFGHGSLFELLSTARTRAGEATLASWLMRAALPDELAMRREAVIELAPALDLREALALAGTDVRAAVDSDALLDWAEADSVLRGPWRRHAAAVLTALVVASAAYGIGTGGNYTPVIAVLAVQALFALPGRGRVQRALHAATGPARDLDVVAQALFRLEREPFRTARLTALRSELETTGIPASAAIRQLHRLVELHDWQHNQFFAPLAAALLWGTHLAWAIEAWRRRHGTHVRRWIRVVGEVEALGSIAAYRYEHPDDVWPEFVEGSARFEAASIGHPFIAAGRMVRNDVRLSRDTRLLVVSGSNMSGKSTLLRTVGVNAVLAQAGAPVRATALRLTPLAVGATLRLQDSLQEGRSRFYAEITRLRELSDLARGSLPLLFLFDELFHGTNSHDRQLGASGLLKNLTGRGAIGLITTHDLALAAIAEGLAPHAANVHFEDRFEGGEILFDYRLRPGPVTRSNAMALMRAVGLDVDRERT